MVMNMVGKRVGFVDLDGPRLDQPKRNKRLGDNSYPRSVARQTLRLKSG
jgi:hypothetical protein